ncbi:glycoside hydrolase family 1 protein [Enterococcus gilvus]|uniref:glycoside hydrolase family 1 protein n=1 Tax=Enterococcus gilvus TaxID=160453 RepID=UPI000DF5EB67|nr:glycoside hydrolase family 1 protein [Enterococcus gilvus]AXG39009.1 glycoside hydrolase family 1 protein [Enterococcus gilvus]
MFYKFPDNFSWGSAVWAQGVEGAWNQDGKAMNVYEKYYELSPERFQGMIGPYETLDWYHRYAEYASIAQSINQESFRTSISWARLMPDGKNVNEKAVDFYRNMFSDLKNKGMDVYVVLYWFDMPLMYEDKGGFGNREIISDFVDYCKNCFELFHDVVDIFHVYNEPHVDTKHKYNNDTCYPNTIDFAHQTQAIYNMVLAHALVVKEFKKENYTSKIGSVINYSVVYPRSQHPKDIEAAELSSKLNFKCFMDPLILGYFPKGYFEALDSVGVKPKYEEEDLEIISNNTIDLVGINYYYPERAKAKENLPNLDGVLKQEIFYDFYEMPGRQMNKSRGWEIYPKALYDTLMDVKNTYRNVECYISENGMGIEKEWNFRGPNGEIQDDYRIEFMQEHLISIHQAIEDGVNLKGYHVWSFIDLWSPSNQFKNLYGLIEFNLNDQTARTKKSAHWYAKMIADNGFEAGSK